MCTKDVIKNYINKIPIVGQMKGFGYFVGGDYEAAKKAILETPRSSMIVGAGFLAGAASGVMAAAIPAGIAAGYIYDSADSDISGEPKGIIAVTKNVMDNPNVGTIVDAFSYAAKDAAEGYLAGLMGDTFSTAITNICLIDARNKMMQHAYIGGLHYALGKKHPLFQQSVLYCCWSDNYKN